MSRNETMILVEAARLYYQHNLSQQVIAQKLNVSRPTVSRLLQKAREQGIVEIRIHDPGERGTRLEQQLMQVYSLKLARVVPSAPEYRMIQRHLGKAAAQVLADHVRDGMTVGLSWGTTLQEVARQVKRHAYRQLTVVQLNGGISRAEYDTHASEITQTIADRWEALPYLLPLPAVVSDASVKAAILSDKHISRTLELGRQASLALFTVGSFSRESVLVKADYFDDREVADLLQQGAVGDICSRILDRQGRICSPELDHRTIGIELEELQRKELAIAVAGGREKLAAIRAGLRGRWFNGLITDEGVARELVETEEAQ
ncbi:MAG: sugar-binding transcriptional regulator [Candidatus Neomarinimicrobiota bacterium]|nr:MAG: sugar-binding transcriptional regulator [Candidatus Neomarinimicrobiota bacterium]